MADQAERYKLVLSRSGLSKKDFAESLGLSLSMSYQIASGRLKLPRDLLERLSARHGVNLHWFITGDGSPGIGDDTAIIELYEQEAAAGPGREVEDFIPQSSFIIPLSLIHPHRPDSLRGVYVSGDSMTGEHINDGDIVIFNTKMTEGNGIYVVSMGNTLLVKRVDFDTTNGTIILISANPAYEPRRYSGQELDDIRVVGRVVVSVHRI